MTNELIETRWTHTKWNGNLLLEETKCGPKSSLSVLLQINAQAESKKILQIEFKLFFSLQNSQAIYQKVETVYF